MDIISTSRGSILNDQRVQSRLRIEATKNCVSLCENMTVDWYADNKCFDGKTLFTTNKSSQRNIPQLMATNKSISFKASQKRKLKMNLIGRRVDTSD